MNGGLSQRARVMAEFTLGKPPLSVAEALEAFRRNWNRRRTTGIRQDMTLPPMDGAQMQEALNIAFDDYWGGRGFAAFGEYRELLNDTRAAIFAAHARYRAERGKSGTNAELRLILRARDGDDCWVCGHDLGEDATIEHKVALANGGTWALDNLALAHKSCNQALGRLPLAAKEAARTALKEARNG